MEISITKKELKILLDLTKNKDELKELYSKLWKISLNLNRGN